MHYSNNQSRALFTTASLVILRSLRRVDNTPQCVLGEAVSSVDSVESPLLWPLRLNGTCAMSESGKTGSRLGRVLSFRADGIELCSMMNRDIQLSNVNGSDMDRRQKSSKVLRRAA